MLSLHIIESSFFPNVLVLDNCAAQLRSHLHIFKCSVGGKLLIVKRTMKITAQKNHLCNNTWHNNESMTTYITL